MLSRDAPTSIGRFEILRPLGAGAQGAVYLARDTRLGRPVAIKTLRLRQKAGTGIGDPLRKLLDEARIVSQLTHPNIVTLFDAGDDNGRPYLVFEYVEGTSLSQHIRERGPLAPERAVDIAIQVLRGIGHAHRKGVLHRDIKPANVILSGSEDARVTDFGIAQLFAAGAPESDEFAGTPAYVAPEVIGERRHSTRSDLFAVGVLLYEMLTGRPAVSGASAFEVLNRIAHQPFAPPSAANSAVDDRLDDIVLKALAKDPAARYESAQHMENALYLYLHPEPGTGAAEPAATPQGTLDFLLRRMRHKSDFPALSGTIGAVNRATDSDGQAVNSLSNAILKDFALTNKLLKMVNAACYGQFRGSISTISRAIVILGFDRVRSVAITLLLLDHLQNRAQAAKLKDDLIGAYFGGVLARELALPTGLGNAEEAFICAAFHRLGRLLSRFYFPEEDLEIDRLIRLNAMDEDQAALKVLGISLEDLGIGVARAWHFPARLSSSMRRVRDARLRRSAREEDRLATLSELCAGVSEALRAPACRENNATLSRLLGRFGDGLGIDEELLRATIERAVKELEKDAESLGLSLFGSHLLNRAAATADSHHDDATQPLDPTGEAISSSLLDAAHLGAAGAPQPPPAVSAERKAALSAGIQDITSTLVGDYRLNDVLRIVVETMYRAIGFTRVLLFVRDPGRELLQCRFGLGADVERLIRLPLAFDLGPPRDVFKAAVASGVDIFVENVAADAIRDHIPAWFRNAVPARSFTLFPIALSGRAIGLLYGDSDEAGALHFQADELSLLKTLRNQAVLAIKNQQ